MSAAVAPSAVDRLRAAADDFGALLAEIFFAESQRADLWQPDVVCSAHAQNRTTNARPEGAPANDQDH